MNINPKDLPLLGSLSQREQAKESMKDLIQRGKLSSQGYIPSIREAANLIGFNRDAVWRAYIDLEKEGYIETTSNKRYKIHPGVRNSPLRTLDVRLITVGKDSIRFSGLQRFHKTLVENESLYGIRTHLKCAVDASEIRPEWLEGMDGLILGGSFEHSELLEKLTCGIPSIGIITSQTLHHDFTIDTDNRLAGELAATRLIEAGAPSPYLVAYTERDSRHTLRKLGFQTKWVESGRSLDDITEHWINPSNTYLRVVKLERKARSMQDCDSVFCLEKESAIDLLNILEHRNIKVPDSIKVLSVDGAFDGLKTKPTLTYVKQMFRDMASTAAEKMRLLCSSTDTKKTGTSTEKVLVAPQLVVRQSA